MYEVIKAFADGEHGYAYPAGKGGHTYAVGDKYPAKEFEPPEEHIRYLLGKDNAYGQPLIKAIKLPKTGSKQAAEPAEEPLSPPG